MSVIVERTIQEHEQLLINIEEATGLLRDICEICAEFYYPKQLLFEEYLIRYLWKNNGNGFSKCFKELQKNADPLAKCYLKTLDGIAGVRYTAWEVFCDTMNSLDCTSLDCFRVECMWATAGCHCNRPVDLRSILG